MPVAGAERERQRHTCDRSPLPHLHPPSPTSSTSLPPTSRTGTLAKYPHNLSTVGGAISLQ
jgi:hypothetical protein